MFCFIKDCKMGWSKRKDLDPKVPLYKFPTNEELFQKWLVAVGVHPTSVQWKPTMCLCSEHFKKEDFLVELKKISDTEYNKVLVLKDDAVPFLPSSSNDTTRNHQQPIAKSGVEDISESGRSPYIRRPIAVRDKELPCKSSTNKPEVEVLLEVVQLDKDPSATEKSLHQAQSGSPRRYFQPRYVGDVVPADLEDPRNAKLCLVLAKNTLSKQTKLIKQLKNHNRKLYKKLENLKTLAKIARKGSKKSTKKK